MITTIQEFRKATSELANKYKVKKCYVEAQMYDDNKVMWWATFNSPKPVSVFGENPDEVILKAEQDLIEAQNPIEEAMRLIQLGNSMITKFQEQQAK